MFRRRCGGIGRRKGLKIPRSNIRAGSSPASGTKKCNPILVGLHFLISLLTDLNFFLGLSKIFYFKRFLGRGEADE